MSPLAAILAIGSEEWGRRNFSHKGHREHKGGNGEKGMEEVVGGLNALFFKVLPAGRNLMDS